MKGKKGPPHGILIRHWYAAAAVAVAAISLPPSPILLYIYIYYILQYINTYILEQINDFFFFFFFFLPLFFFISTSRPERKARLGSAGEMKAKEEEGLCDCTPRDHPHNTRYLGVHNKTMGLSLSLSLSFLFLSFILSFVILYFFLPALSRRSL